MNHKDKIFHLSLFLALLPILIWSAISPYDRLTWYLEVAPVAIGLVLLMFTYHRFVFTRLVYFLIGVHMVILLVGGHYTYARVPFLNGLQEWAGFERNHYDRLGHFAQGFVPAMIAREILLRKKVIHSTGGWLFFCVISICLAISASYELLEWGAALFAGSVATDFLGAQGDIWDTQADMFGALCGVTFSLLLLSGLHNQELDRLSAF